MPSMWRALVAGLRRLLGRSTADRDFADEARHYQEQSAEEYRRAGLSPEAAARAARVEFGSVATVRDHVRGSGWEATLESIWRDVVHGARALRRSPGFTSGAVMVLALSIGVNTAVFSIINAVLFRPLPVRAPSELAFVYPDRNVLVVAYEEMTSWRQATEIFSDVASVSGDSAQLGLGLDKTRMEGESVSTNYFELLGLSASKGRVLSPTIDEAADAAPVVVISNRVWRRKFDADPDIIGRVIRLGVSQRADTGWRYTIVGVMPPEFTGVVSPWQATDFWVPVLQRKRELDLGVSDAPLTAQRVGIVIGRRRSGVSIEQAQAFVRTRHSSYKGPEAIARARIDASLVVRDSRQVKLPFDEAGRIAPSRLAAALMGVAGMVLLIGVANLVGVTVARGIVRRSEIAIRLTIGASRARLARQLVIEGLLLSALGGVGGVIGSRWLVASFLAATPSGAGLETLVVPLDTRVLVFTLLVVVLVGVVVGLAPLREASKTDLLVTLRGGSETGPGRSRARLRHWIIVPQVCVCMTLLLAAGVATRALLRVAFRNPGYQPSHAALVQLDLVWLSRGFQAPKEQRAAEFRRLQERAAYISRRVVELAEAAPEVDAVGLSTASPTGGHEISFVLRAGFSADSIHYSAAHAQVTPGYFAAIGLPLTAGRLLDRRDIDQSAKVIVVDEIIAARLWPGRSPISEFLGLHGAGSTQIPDWLEVVGVVGPVRHPLSEGEWRPFVYLPWPNGPSGDTHVPTSPLLVARGRGSDADLVTALRRAVAAADPETAVTSAGSLTQSIDTIRYPRRIATALLVSSASIGLVLAALGLYGVVSYSVAQRRRELGIRAALGADRRDLLKLIMREGIVVALIGSASGFVIAFAGIRVVSNQVFAMPELDLTTALAVPLVLITVVLLACYLQARRAARVDPMTALRWL